MSQSPRDGQALATLRQMDESPLRLDKDDFTLTNATAGTRSKVASFVAPNPMHVRQESFRIMLAYHEGFYHDGATTANQTYSLSLDAIDTPNTTSFEVFADSTRLTEGTAGALSNGEFSVDYAADELTIEQNTDVTIHAFYYAADGLVFEIVKEKPGSTGSIDEVLYDDITSDLFQRNQNRNPPRFSLQQSAYQPVIPRDWELALYTDGSNYGVDWDDADTDTSGSKTVNDVSPVGTIIDIPVRMSGSNVAGLSREVAMDIGARR